MVLASVLLIACEQENLSFGPNSSSSRSTSIALVAQPPTDEDVITVSLTSFTTDAFPQGPTDSDTLIHVTDIPAPCTLWKDHVVILVEPTFAKDDNAYAAEARVTLLSKSEWCNLPSALNNANPKAAFSIQSTYTEGTLTDWHIPSAAEAKALKAAYTLPHSSGPVLEGSAFESLNALLRTLEASELHLTEGTTNARYLCEDATRTFSFAPNTTISTAGTKATNYRLRLVKTFRFRQKQ